jgi:hypothetical protein
MKKVYYAHFMGIYNTPQEKRDIETLENLGFDVVNPNSEGISETFKGKKEQYAIAHNSDMFAFDDVFFELVRNCEVFAFRGLPNGRIPGGVAMELKHAKEKGKMIIELPCSLISRTMNGEETREYLHDMGER